MLFNSLRRRRETKKHFHFSILYLSASSNVNFKDNKAMNILHNNYFVQNLVIKSQLVQLKVEKCSEESTTLWSLKLDKKSYL